MLTIPFEKFTLANGLQVILHQDRSLPMVAVNVWYNVGSKDEEAGRTGFAHLFEHMMFEGSKNHNKSFFEPLQKVGANLNGSTTNDRTNYWETLPSNYLDLALWLESDRMGYLLDALDQSRFDIQRDVVKNERRQSYENRPYGMAQLALQPVVYPAPHPYSWPVIGSQEHLDAASLDDVKDFFRRFYAPSNASLALAGDIDPDDVRRRVEHYFGDLPPGPPISRIGRMSSDLSGEVAMTLQDKVQLPRLYLVWPTLPMFDADEAPLDVLASVLGDGKSSRLSRTLVFDKQVARDVNVGSWGQAITGEFEIVVTANPGVSLSELRDVVEDELERIRTKPPAEQEVQRAKNRIQSDRVAHLERIGGFYGKADLLNMYNLAAGDPGVINTDLQRYLEVSAEDVSRVAGSSLNGNRVELRVLPEESHSAVTTAEIDRASMPVPTSSKRFTPPVPGRDKLSNGLDVLYLQKEGLPMVTFGLVIQAGAVTDPQDAPGLANMTATMMPEGTARRSRERIAEEMEFLGANLGRNVGRVSAGFSAETLTEHWPKGLEILADVVKNPSFPAEEFERVRKERLTDLRRMSDDPNAIAGLAGRALVYGPESPYGHHSPGSEEAIESLRRDALLEHYERLYSPGRATLLVVGDVTPEDMMREAEAHLGNWSGAEVERSEPGGGKSPDIRPTTIYLADKPGAAQSVIQAGHLTIPRDDPDFYAMTLLNYVFGGQATARLFMNLREDKGYSYGYYSSIDWAAGPSLLMAGGAVQTAVTKEAVAETLKEYADIRGARPVGKQEYDDSRDGMFRSFPARFETQQHIMQQLMNLVTFGLPDDYYTDYISNMEGVSLQQLNEVAAARVDDSGLVVLVVGDREVVEPGLRELGLPLTLVDYEGRPLA